MKKLLAFAGLSLGVLSFQASAAFDPCPMNETVFYAKTANHQKQVTVCKVGHAYRYTFAKADGTVEKDIIESEKKVSFDYGSGHDYAVATINFPVGKITYSVGYVASSESNIDEHNVTVYQNGKELAVVKLDQKTVLNAVHQFVN